MAPAIANPPLAIPAMQQRDQSIVTPVSVASDAPNWAHLMIRSAEFFVGGIILVVGVGALLRHATGASVPRRGFLR